jgi:hypothetical protein
MMCILYISRDGRNLEVVNKLLFATCSRRAVAKDAAFGGSDTGRDRGGVPRVCSCLGKIGWLGRAGRSL